MHIEVHQLKREHVIVSHIEVISFSFTSSISYTQDKALVSQYK